MIRSIYTINRSMNLLQTKQENASANIANMSTPGYKFQDLVASSLQSHSLVNHQGGNQKNQRAEIGDFVFGNQVDQVYRNFSQGNLYETEKNTDFAISGRGFFTIQLANGEIAYTRNGNFRLDDNNQLVSLEGYPILGRDNNGNIGFIYGNNNEISKEQLLITDFDNYETLDNWGENIFRGTGGYYMENPQLEEGYLETSNAHIGDQLVKLIEIAREFESHQRLIHASDETLSKAVNEIGRV